MTDPPLQAWSRYIAIDIHPAKARASARWAFVMEALRAPTLAGPRAALSWRGGLRMPEASEKHALGEG